MYQFSVTICCSRFEEDEPRWLWRSKNHIHTPFVQIPGDRLGTTNPRWSLNNQAALEYTNCHRWNSLASRWRSGVRSIKTLGQHTRTNRWYNARWFVTVFVWETTVRWGMSTHPFVNQCLMTQERISWILGTRWKLRPIKRLADQSHLDQVRRRDRRQRSQLQK